MKHPYIYASAIVTMALLLSTACNKDNDTELEAETDITITTIYAGVENQNQHGLKTTQQWCTADASHTIHNNWEGGETINLVSFQRNDNSYNQGSFSCNSVVSDGTATFTGSLNAKNNGTVIAIYKGAINTTDKKNAMLTCSFPSDQTYGENGLSATIPMYASAQISTGSNGNGQVSFDGFSTLMFKNMSGIVKFDATAIGKKITNVTANATNIAGGANIEYNDITNPTITMSNGAANTVTVSCPQGSEICLMAVAPITYNGMTFNITLEGGEKKEVKITKETTFHMSKFKTIVIE